MHFGWTNPKYNDGKGDIVFLCHGTIVPNDCIKLSAPAWFAAVANCGGSGAGGEDFHLENLVVMEVKVAIQDGKA